MKIQSLIILLSIALLSSCNGTGPQKTISKTQSEPEVKVIEFIRSLKLKQPLRGKLYTKEVQSKFQSSKEKNRKT